MQPTTCIPLIAILAYLLLSPVAEAKSLRLSNTQAQGQNKTVSVQVWPGYGLNVSFIETGEMIIKAWLDDPSRIAMDLDGTKEGASVVHLRRIKAQELPLMTSQDGSTLLTVITQSDRGRKLYQIRVVPVDGKPDYFAVNIGPGTAGKPKAFAQLPVAAKPVQSPLPPAPPISQKIPTVTPPAAPSIAPPAAVASAVVTKPSRRSKVTFQAIAGISPSKSVAKSEELITSTNISPLPARSKPLPRRMVVPKPQLSGRQQSLTDANALVRGLVVAHRMGEVNRGSLNWYRLQSAVAWMRRGKSRADAARLVRLNLSLVERVIALGNPANQS
ncbi:MAG TPA: hypothetical protein V6D19_10915 [Stenomitos sp.]